MLHIRNAVVKYEADTMVQYSKHLHLTVKETGRITFHDHNKGPSTIEQGPSHIDVLIKQ